MRNQTVAVYILHVMCCRQRVYECKMVYDPEGILGTMTSVVLCVLGVEVGFLSQTVYAIVIDTE